MPFNEKIFLLNVKEITKDEKSSDVVDTMFFWFIQVVGVGIIFDRQDLIYNYLGQTRLLHNMHC